MNPSRAVLFKTACNTGHATLLHGALRLQKKRYSRGLSLVGCAESRDSARVRHPGLCNAATVVCICKKLAGAIGQNYGGNSVSGATKRLIRSGSNAKWAGRDRG